MSGNGSTAVGEMNLTRKDFVSDQEVRWCPGCGDYSILAQMQKVVPSLGIPREKFVFVSGIGCSSRFPYYMNTYGFHSIHGRAPALATGVKLANPDLSVWVITGDGDGLSIGGNHLIHAIRRNIDINIILFNNRIYGLTKGQYSPTSELGKKTKSSPYGTIDQPLNPLCVAIAAEATFVARSIDIDTNHLTSVLEMAARHKGISFVEIYQNCNIFNDGAFVHFTDRQYRPERVLYLEHGKPMVFGKDNEKGIRLNGLNAEIVDIGPDFSTEDLLTHDETASDPTLAYLLTRMHYPNFPVPVGVFRNVEKREYSEMLHEQVREVTRKEGKGNLSELLAGPETWVVEDESTRIEKLSAHDAPSEGDASYTDQEAAVDNGGKCEIKAKVLEGTMMDIPPDDPIIVTPKTSIALVIQKMIDQRQGAALIMESERVVGIFTERDALNRVADKITDLDNTPISEVMTADPILTQGEATLTHALNQMAVHGLRHLPIEEDGKIAGVTSVKKVLAHIARNTQ